MDKDEAFLTSVEAVQADRPIKGANAAWVFIAASDRDDPRYDRALRLLGQSAEEMGLTFAASMIYRQIAQDRRNMEIVPDAIAGIERIIRSGAYDEDTLLTSFVAAEEFGFLPSESRAFVDFYQGLDLSRRGMDDWADKRFAALPETSPYALRASFVRAVGAVADGDYDKAVDRLEALKEEEGLDASLDRDVRRTLARLAFEEQRYDDAVEHFETLRELAPDDPDILLEMAWTTFYLGDSRKTLGLLIALDAPIHSSYVSPERYLLEALALRRLCQFGAAREAAVRLEERFGDSLGALADGRLPARIPELRQAARHRGLARGDALLEDRLRVEKEILAHKQLEDGLTEFLDGIYSRGILDTRRREARQIDREVEHLAQELLSAQEGVRLIMHELGVSMLRGRRRPPGAREKPAVEIPITGDTIFFPFQGEYWTDEMDDLVVIAEDRCVD